MMRSLFLLMVCFLFAQPLWAQGTWEGVTYDPVTNWYTIRYLSIDDSTMQEASLRPGDQVEPHVTASVTFGADSSLYRYGYEVANEIGARQGLHAFEVEVQAFTDSVTAPNAEWRKGLIERYSRHRWAHTRGATVGIAAGVSETGFSFQSPGLPVITNGFASGHMLLAFDDHGPGGAIRAIVDSLKQFKRRVALQTLGPKDPPDPFDPLTFLDTLRTYPQRAAGLSWITDPAVAADLEATLDLARAQLVAGDSSDASGSLFGLLAQVEAAQGSSLTSDAFGLLTFNTEYLLRFLPPPPQPVLPDLPGAITVASDEASGSFSGNAFSLSGFDHALSGQPTGSGNDAKGILTTTTAAQQSLLDALKNNQHDNVTGLGGNQPNIVQGDLDFDPAALIDELLSLVTDTLTTSPGGTLGSPSDPVVAYAPDGLTLSGNLSGTGVLIVDGPYSQRGSVAWTGLLVVRSDAAVPPSFEMRGNVGVTGAVLLYNETASAASLVITGNAEVRYSREAFEMLRAALFPTP